MFTIHYTKYTEVLPLLPGLSVTLETDKVSYFYFIIFYYMYYFTYCTTCTIFLRISVIPRTQHGHQKVHCSPYCHFTLTNQSSHIHKATFINVPTPWIMLYVTTRLAFPPAPLFFLLYLITPFDFTLSSLHTL